MMSRNRPARSLRSAFAAPPARQRRRSVTETPTGAAKTPIAILAALTLIGSILASGGIAAAQTSPSTAEALPRTSACVDDALDTYGFDDVGGLDADRQDAINCLAYYRITVGKTADPPTYDPAGNVTRSQMALFLYRTAQAAGIDINAKTERSAMFSDIGDLGDDWQTAINALHAHNIMTGRQAGRGGIAGVASDDTFVPYEAVTRAEMAHYLRNLVRAAKPDMFDKNGRLQVGSLDDFPDARTGTPAAVNDAIAEAYELGITTGVSQTPRTFDPSGLVTRSQMALFITRTLAHTTARPIGLTAQQDGSTLTLSLRGRDFQPLADSGLYVDVFTAAIDDTDNAFDRNGECSNKVTEHDGYYLCEIDRGDTPLEDGDAVVDFGDEIPSAGLAAWLWIGERGDEYQNADEADIVEHVFDGSTLPPPAAKTLTVTYSGVRTDSDGNPRTARIGSTVTVHVQLQGSYTDEPDRLVDVPAPAGGVTYDLDLRLYTGKDDPNTANVDERNYRAIAGLQTLALDADGYAWFDLLAPSAIGLSGAYTSSFTLTQRNVDSMGANLDARGEVSFASAEAAKATTVEFSNYDRWVDIANIGTRAREVTVTVYDQFGRTMPNVPVLLIATDDGTDQALDITGADDPDTPDTDAHKHEVMTDRRGEADFRYTYTRASGDFTAATVTLHAGFDGDGNPDVSDPALNNLDDGNGALCETLSDPKVATDADYRDVCSYKVMVYYAQAAGDDSAIEADGTTPVDSATESYRILYADTDPRRRGSDAGPKIVVQLFDASSAATSEGPQLVDFSGARDEELFTAGYSRDDTPAQQRAAFTAALMKANEAAVKVAKAGETPMAADYCKLTWRTPARGSWTFDVTDCPAM